MVTTEATETGAADPAHTLDDIPSSSSYDSNTMRMMGKTFVGWLVDVPEQREAVRKPSNIAGSRIDSIVSISEEEFQGHIDEDDVKRTGTTLTSCAHILTAAIGTGMLGLPYAMATFGWILGPILFLFLATITLFMCQLLADLYFIDGERQRTYTDMVYTCYGKGGMIALGVTQQINLILTAVLTIVVGCHCLKNLAQSHCGTYNVPEDECYDKRWMWAVVFGALQLILSQIPTLESFWWASVVGAIAAAGTGITIFGTALAYPGIGTSGIQPLDPTSFNATNECLYQPANYTKYAQEEDIVKTVPGAVWNALNAIGTILFPYCFSFILLEVQDTIRTIGGDPTSPTRMMKKAINISIGAMTILYLALSLAVFGSLGYCVAGDIDVSYVGIAPDWVIKIADLLMLAHVIPAFQVWSQPHFEFIDMYAERSKLWPRWLGKGWVLRLWYRSLYVVVLTGLSIVLPFFRILAGLVGAIGFYPATVYFPTTCWIKVYQPKIRVRRLLVAINILLLILSILMIAASIRLLIYSSSSLGIWPLVD